MSDAGGGGVDSSSPSECHLVEYSSSDDSDRLEDFVARTSPRKKRKYPGSHASAPADEQKKDLSVDCALTSSSPVSADSDPLGGYPLDSEGNINIRANPNYDPIADLCACYESAWSGFGAQCVDRVEDLLCRSGDDSPPTDERDQHGREFQLDVDSLQLKVCSKRDRLEAAGESSALRETSSVLSAVSAADEASIDVGVERQPPPLPQRSEKAGETSAAGATGDEDCEARPPTPDGKTVLEFKTPQLRCRKFIFKPFRRLPESGQLVHDEARAAVDVVIPEQLAASYGLYIWPASPVISWYIWLHQSEFVGKRVLELGAGTALPGLLCAKIGAEKVWLSDDFNCPESIDNCREGVRKNGLEDRVEVIGLTWGEYTEDLFALDGQLDFIIGSDLFFDPEVFDSLCETVAYLLQRNQKAKFYCSVQERSSDWSIEEQCLNWKLRADYIYPKEFLAGTGIEEADLTGKHEIFILQLFKSED